mmetsp:Transcript_314/g.952  ORF Transcript_314/g.952 Transcript_314/m.952 type:complete len:392 (-) Transcript_314:25-1200(-)
MQRERAAITPPRAAAVVVVLIFRRERMVARAIASNAPLAANVAAHPASAPPMAPMQTVNAAQTCIGGCASNKLSNASSAPWSRAAAAEAAEALHKCPRANATGTVGALGFLSRAVSSGPAPPSLQAPATEFDPLHNCPTSAAPYAAVSASPAEAEPRHASRSVVASGFQKPRSLKCCTETASARQACRRNTRSRCRSMGKMSASKPSFERIEASSSLCWPMQPMHDRVIRRRGSDGSFRHSLSRGSTPELATAFASSALCFAIAARHQTASVLVPGSSASTRSQRGASTPNSTSSIATSAEESALACRKKSAALSNEGEATRVTVSTTWRNRSGWATLMQSELERLHILPIAIIALCCTDGARSATSGAMSITRVSDASSAARIFSSESTS